MRPAGKAPLDSLYFEYPTFPFRRPPEMDGSTATHPVAIAGAGPVGMTAALELARHGVPSVVLDRKATFNDGSRAICISRNSLETLQQLGVAERFVAKGLGWTRGRCYYRDRMFYRLQMPHSDDERFYPMYNLQQQYVEQFLAERMAEMPGLIDQRWQSEVTGVDNGADGVVLTVATPEGDYELTASHLLAADGARSRVRELLDLRLEGDNLPGHYVIADIRMAHDFPTERRSFFESSANPDATILIHRQPDDIWRVDWQLRDGQDPEAAVAEETVRAQVRAILDMIGHDGPWELEWWSIYTANTLCLGRYRHGRVLFIGDAAHIVPIFGVRGLNNGITDAVNAAWKLAYLHNGLAGDALLDSYSPERREATLDVFRNAGRSSRFMTPPSRGFALLRKAALQLSLSKEFAGRLADPRQVQPYTYRDSPLTGFRERDLEFAAGVPAGDVARNCRIADDDFLLDHLGRGFTGLWFAGRPAEADATPFAALRELDPEFRLVVVGASGAADGSVDFVADPGGHVRTTYGADDDSFYLLRPDRHVAARWRQFRKDEALAALRQALAEDP